MPGAAVTILAIPGDLRGNRAAELNRRANHHWGHQGRIRKAADADPEVAPSIGDHVDGRGDLREHGRQPNPVVRLHQPEPQPPRLRGQGGEQRPPLVHGP